MSNGYNAYDSYETNILNIIENEKQSYDTKMKKYNKKRGFTTDTQHIYNEIKFTLQNSYIDFMNGNLNKLFQKDRWSGIGYFILFLLTIYFIVIKL